MIALRILLVIAAIAGLLLPQFGIQGTELVTPLLAISVFFSLLASKKPFKFEWSALKTGIIYNYLVLTTVLLVLSFFMPPGLKEGVIMYALFPPAIGLIVLSEHWGGDEKGVFLFQILSYVISLILVPLAALLFFGKMVDPVSLIKTLVIVFALPAAASFFVSTDKRRLVATISNIALALVFYIVISMSASSIIQGFAQLLGYSLVLFAVSIITSYLVLKYTKDPDAVLYSFMKNGGAAAAVSSLLLPPLATVIISAKVFMDIIMIVIFGHWFERKRAQ